jgi:hypothetical protein
MIARIVTFPKMTKVMPFCRRPDSAFSALVRASQDWERQK